MAITEAFAGNQTVTTTEHSMVNDSSTIATDTTDGIYQAFVDFNALVAGDSFQFRIYEKVGSGSTQRLVWEAIISHTQSAPVFTTPAIILMHGWDMTLKKLTGTDRSIDWSIRKVA